jgi:hypothetical protein
MKHLLLIVSLFNFLFCSAQFTSIPDPNFEDYLEQNGMGDGVPNNSLVLTANIENVIALPVDSKNIQDLTGIEDFTNLQILNCSFNDLTFLDVSQNMNLWLLNCQTNNLAELLLPPSEALNNLNCTENSLTTLDISLNPGLVQLYCSYNSLTALSLVNHPDIEIIVASYNNISGVFDTSQNPVLNSLEISHNGISGIDLSLNPLITGFNAGDNSLESLDARNGNNENIGNFNASGTHGILTCILVDDANASYLDNWLKDIETTFVNNQQECDALGLTDIKIQDLTVYPNPANETFVINLPYTASYNLFDIKSKRLQCGQLGVGNNKISVLGFDAGIYFLKINTDNEVYTKKIVVY